MEWVQHFHENVCALSEAKGMYKTMKTELRILLTAESTDVDFKVSLEKAKPKSWLKTVVAFSNGIGGSILFGVDNERHLIGLS